MALCNEDPPRLFKLSSKDAWHEVSNERITDSHLLTSFRFTVVPLCLSPLCSLWNQV